MRLRSLFLLAGVIAALSCAAVSAGPVAVSAKLSTLGYGGDVTIDMGPVLNARVGINLFSYNTTVSLEDADIDGDIDFRTIPILLDVHPAESGFRISGGVVINNNEIRLSVAEGAFVELEGTDFEIKSLKGEISFSELSYYLGIGYGNAVGDDGKWHFACDFGVMYHGKPDVSAKATAVNPVVEAALDAALAAEIADKQDEIDKYTWYPVISFGVSFAF